MSRRLASTELPHWPRMLSRELAAAYLGTTISGFDRLCLPCVIIGGKRVWDRVQLDGYADTVAGGNVPAAARDYWLSKVRDADQAQARQEV